MTRLTVAKAGLFACALALGGTAPSLAAVEDGDAETLQESALDLQTRARTTIEAQMAAFQSDDASAAFKFAAPQVRAYFRTPSRFMKMVKSSYAAVYRPSRVAFGPYEERNGKIYQAVNLTGPKGRDWTALYTLREGRDGTLYITSCRVVRANSFGI